MFVVRSENYFRALRSFQMFIGGLFIQIKLHLLSTVSLSVFESSSAALKSAE